MADMVLIQAQPKEEDFVSHRCGPDEELTLYHVHDTPRDSRDPETLMQSQTPYVRGDSINCGDPDNYYMRAWHLITHEKVNKHLDWSNREPTQFISFYDYTLLAIREEEARKERFRSHKLDRLVRIAVVSATKLDETKAFYFSKGELGKMLLLSTESRVFEKMHGAEWLVFGAVPDEAVVADYSIEEVETQLGGAA